jgi:hypothetical protein
MSKNSGLMDTAPGGEQTPYEAEHTDVDPPAKLSGQLGGMFPFSASAYPFPKATFYTSSINTYRCSTQSLTFPLYYATHQLICVYIDSPEGTATAKSLNKKTTDEPNTQGVSTAAKIRFGQKISEEGMGGQTSSSIGSASTEGMYSPWGWEV